MPVSYLRRYSHEENYTDFGESVDLTNELSKGQTHYVSIAMPGFTMASHYINMAGLTVEQRYDFMMQVNQRREVGTLYPKANITLLPSPKAKDRFGFGLYTFNEGDYAFEEVVAHILDAFQIEIQYVKSNKMYFDFRNLCVSERLYLLCLESALERLKKTDLPEVIT